MVGQERSVVPLPAEQTFAIGAFTASLTVIVVFGVHQRNDQPGGRRPVRPVWPQTRPYLHVLKRYGASLKEALGKQQQVNVRRVGLRGEVLDVADSAVHVAEDLPGLARTDPHHATQYSRVIDHLESRSAVLICRTGRGGHPGRS
jgi:hypothetical protein